jgi:peptide/nickel transport system substrate-binding protein
MLKRGLTSWVYVYFTQIESCKVTDKHTFRVTMKEPAELLQALAAYFGGVPICSLTAVGKWGKGWNRHPVGTWPFIYRFEEYKPDELIVLEKNPNY